MGVKRFIVTSSEGSGLTFKRRSIFGEKLNSESPWGSSRREPGTKSVCWRVPLDLLNQLCLLKGILLSVDRVCYSGFRFPDCKSQPSLLVNINQSLSGMLFALLEFYLIFS